MLGESAGDEGLLREAVLLARQAVAETDSPPLRARMSAELAATLNEVATRWGDTSLDGEMLRALADAVAVTDASPRLRLRAARTRASILAAAGRWDESLADYATAIGLVGQVAARHLASDDKQHELAGIADLGADAAACAISAGDPRRALELAEHARGVLMAEAFDAQSDLSDLRAQAPELALRFETLRDELNAVPPVLPRVWTTEPSADAITGATFRAEQRHHLGQQWNALLREIRGLPGLEAFLEPPSVETLAVAAADGPVVLLNVSRYRCDALALRRRDDGSAAVRVIPLPGVTPEVVAAYANVVRSCAGAGAAEAGSDLTLTDVCEWLSEAVVRPVLADLGQLGAGLPRVWWCPTGFLSYLPVHAAALDHVVSSYTPSIRALAHHQADGHDPQPEMSAVVVALSAGLPAVAAEAQLVADKFPGALVLKGPQARHETVVAALADHRLSHFACHAVSVDDDPSASHLVLYDHASNPLTVADVMRCDTRAAELAFLSACSTAQASPVLTDEALHITSAFHVAGFAQVIGTLWPVLDSAAGEIAGDFYASYLPDGTRRPPATAAYALHEAIRRARDKYREYPLVWASHVHVGRLGPWRPYGSVSHTSPVSVRTRNARCLPRPRPRASANHRPATESTAAKAAGLSPA